MTRTHVLKSSFTSAAARKGVRCYWSVRNPTQLAIQTSLFRKVTVICVREKDVTLWTALKSKNDLGLEEFFEFFQSLVEFKCIEGYTRQLVRALSYFIRSKIQGVKKSHLKIINCPARSWLFVVREIQFRMVGFVQAVVLPKTSCWNKPNHLRRKSRIDRFELVICAGAVWLASLKSVKGSHCQNNNCLNNGSATVCRYNVIT